MEEYLIKRLKVLDKYYLYDGKTNYLCEIPEEISGKINKESFEDEGGLFTEQSFMRMNWGWNDSHDDNDYSLAAFPIDSYNYDFHVFY